MPVLVKVNDVRRESGGHRIAGLTFTDNRCVGLHGLVDIRHMRQDFILDIDQSRSLARSQCRGCRHGRHCMPVIQCPFSGHYVLQDVPEFSFNILCKIGTGHHSLDPVQRKRS